MTSASFDERLTAAEREALGRQFSGCRFDLVARSALDERIALVRWSPLPSAHGGGMPPLFLPPTQATYVVDSAGLSDAADTRPGGRGMAPPVRVMRVDTTAALEVAYPAHFPGVIVAEPWRLRLRQLWYAAIPLVIVALAGIWLALVLRHPWQP